MSHVAYDLQW
jgi:hypothetical protein